MLKQELHQRIKLFHNRNYTLFVLSGILATLGNGLIYITMSWSAYQLNANVSALTILMLCIWTPTIILGPFFGVCADRFNRKYLIILSNLVRGLAVVSYALLYLAHVELNIY